MNSREIVDTIIHTYSEMADDAVLLPALQQFATTAEHHGASKLFHARDIEGGRGTVSLDAIAVSDEHLIELEYYRDKLDITVSVTGLRSIIYAAVRRRPGDTGMRTQVICDWPNQAQSSWASEDPDHEWLVEFGSFLLSTRRTQ